MPSVRLLSALALLTAGALALAGCSGSESDAPADAEKTVTFTWERNVAGEGEDPTYETTSTDVPLNPENIVVYDMAALDTLGTLGETVDGAPLESVPDYLKGFLSEDAFNAGTLFEADLVEVEANRPDLIIIGGRSAGLYPDLSQIAPTIDLSLTGSFLETLERNTTLLGTILGKKAEAKEALATVTEGIDKAKAAIADAGPSLGVMVSGGELTALSPAKTGNARAARGGIIYDVFGVEPVVTDIAAATHGEPISFEFLLKHDPATLWVVDRDAATSTEGAQPAATVLDNEIVAKTAAAKNDRIFYLNPAAWYIVFGGLTTTQQMIDDVLQAA